MSNIGAPAKTLRERQREQTQDHFMLVAATLFGQRGYDETTIEDIAREAGTSRATIYSYFDSKDAILGAITSRLWLQATDLYMKFGDLESWSYESIQGWLGYVVSAWEKEIVYLRVNGARFQRHDEAYLESHRAYVAALTSNEGLWTQFSSSEKDATALYLISGLELFLSTWLVRGWEGGRDETISALANIWCAVLQMP